MVSVTSFPSAVPPEGSGAFQLMPHSVRATVFLDVERRRDELHLRVRLDVEEFGREDMCAERLGRGDRDRLDGGRALEAPVDQLRVDLCQRPAKYGDALVGDREAQARMDWIGAVGADHRCGGRGAHAAS